MNEMTLPSRHRIRNITFNYQNGTTRNAVKTSSKIWITLIFISISVNIFLNETLDQTTTRKGSSSQNQIEIRYYIVLLYFIRIIFSLI